MILLVMKYSYDIRQAISNETCATSTDQSLEALWLGGYCINGSEPHDITSQSESVSSLKYKFVRTNGPLHNGIILSLPPPYHFTPVCIHMYIRMQIRYQTSQRTHAWIIYYELVIIYPEGKQGKITHVRVSIQFHCHYCQRKLFCVIWKP